jgi:hypothetical protein
MAVLVYQILFVPACNGGLAGWAECRGFWRTAQLVDVGLADVHAIRTNV